MKKKKIVLFLPIIWLILIFGVSSIPNLGSIPLARALLFKMAAHILAFAGLVFWIIVAVEICLPETKESDFLETLFLTVSVIIIAFIVALLSEYYQTLIPGRGANLRDVGFDTIGILMAVGLWSIIKIRKSKKKRQK